MKLQILCVIFSISCAINAEEKSKAEKPKRNIYQLGEHVEYGYYPHQYLTSRYHSQVRTLSEDPSHVDITYKSLEEAKSSQPPHESEYPYQDSVKHASNQQVLQQPIPTYPSPIHPNQKVPLEQLPTVPTQHIIAPNYPVDFHPKVTVYRSEKLTLPPNLKTTPDYIETYTTIPVIYGQPNAQLKYVHPHPKSQYTFITPQHKSAKLQSLPIYQPRNRVYHPHFYQPQVFDNPIVPQLQHYIPQSPNIQSPFEHFTRSHPLHATPAPTTTTTAPPPPKQRESDEEDDDDRRQSRERDDEEDFERGYKESSRGFSSYRDDEEDDYKKPRYDTYKSRYGDDDDESLEEDSRGHHSHKQYSYPKNAKRGGRKDREEYEGHYSQKYNKKQPIPSRYRDDDYDDRNRSKKYRKSKKASGDYRQAASSTKPKVVKSDSKGEFKKPVFEYGFEPMRNPYENKNRKTASSGEEKPSTSSSKKVYKESLYISKTDV